MNLFQRRMEAARDAFKKLGFDDGLLMIHSRAESERGLREGVQERVACQIRDHSTGECEPLMHNNLFSHQYGDGARQLFSATPRPMTMSRTELHDFNQQLVRLSAAFMLGGTALELASRGLTAIFNSLSLEEPDPAARWVLCLFDATMRRERLLGLPPVNRSYLPTKEAFDFGFNGGPDPGVWWARLPNCCAISVALIDLMLAVVEQTDRSPAVAPMGAVKLGRKPKLVDPDTEAIRRTYATLRNVKATVEHLNLKSLSRVTPYKRVQRIVDADKRAKTRRKSS